MANILFPVAGFAPAPSNGFSRNNKFPRLSLTTTEQAFQINCAWAPGARMKITMVPITNAALYHSVSGQSQADGFTIAVGGALTILVQHGDVLYLSSSGGAGQLDVLQVDN